MRFTYFWENLFGGGQRLYLFEKNLLAAVEAKLCPQSQHLLRLQVDAINKVQRAVQGTEINFYRMAKGCPTFDDSIRFPSSETEVRFATLHLAHPNKKETLRATIWAVQGFMSYLHFSKPPHQFYEADVKSIEPEFLKVTVWWDPCLVQ